MEIQELRLPNQLTIQFYRDTKSNLGNFSFLETLSIEICLGAKKVDKLFRSILRLRQKQTQTLS
jgi:hypothetical protein